MSASFKTKIARNNRPLRDTLDLVDLGNDRDTEAAEEVLVLFSLKKKVKAGNTKGGSIIVLLTSCLTGLESAE